MPTSFDGGADTAPSDNTLVESADITAGEINPSIGLNTVSGTFTTADTIELSAQTSNIAANPLNYTWTLDTAIQLGYGQFLNINASTFPLKSYIVGLAVEDALGNTEFAYRTIQLIDEVIIEEEYPVWAQTYIQPSLGNGVDILDDQYLTIVESIEFWSDYHEYDVVEIDTILSEVSIRYTYSNDNVLSNFEHIKVIGGGHVYFYGDNYGFSSTQESIDYFLQYNLSDFIINQEDTNDDGLYSVEDINVVVDHLFEGLQYNPSYDFNLDQNNSIIDVLTLCDLIF